MKRLALSAAVAVLAAASLAGAQDRSAGPSPSPAPGSAEQAKEADIRKLMETIGARKLTEQMLDQLLGAVRQGALGVPAEVWDEFRRGLVEDGELERIQLRVWDRYFTHEDVKGLIEFYNTPLGRKLIEQQPNVLRDSMEAGQAWGVRTMERIKQKLRDKGFTVA
jgi:hypothetical protein